MVKVTEAQIRASATCFLAQVNADDGIPVLADERQGADAHLTS